MSRVAFVSFHTSPLHSPGSRDAGGMNVVETELARALAARGHEVELLTRRDDPDSPEVEELAPGVTVRHLTAGPVSPLPKSEHEAHIEEFSEALLALEPYDVVHSHHWMSGVAALPAARAWGVPHVQSFHSVAALPGDSLSEGEEPESPGRNAGERLIARESDLVIAVSEYEAATIIGRCGAPAERVQVIHPGVDTGVFRPFGSEDIRRFPAPPVCRSGTLDLSPVTDATSDCGYVLFAARLQPLKGPDLALAALTRIPENRRPHLVVTGDVSQDFQDYSAELRALADELGVADVVRWCGPQSRESLALLMRGARAVLVPSYSETFGLVALEANASGTPVLATDAGGLGEAIVAGQTGTLLDTRDPNVWGRALRELVENSERARAMGLAGRDRTLSMTWDRAAAAHESAYTALLAALPSREISAHDMPLSQSSARDIPLSEIPTRGISTFPKGTR